MADYLAEWLEVKPLIEADSDMISRLTQLIRGFYGGERKQELPYGCQVVELDYKLNIQYVGLGHIQGSDIFLGVQIMNNPTIIEASFTDSLPIALSSITEYLGGYVGAYNLSLRPPKFAGILCWGDEHGKDAIMIYEDPTNNQAFSFHKTDSGFLVVTDEGNERVVLMHPYRCYELFAFDKERAVKPFLKPENRINLCDILTTNK